MFNLILSVLLINFIGMLSPGPDMLLVLRNASHGRRAALVCVAGILLGFMLHICFAIFGLSMLLERSPQLFSLLRLAGGVFLIYLGIQSLRAKTTNTSGEAVLFQPQAVYKVFLRGLCCNLLNPKTLAFMVSVFSQLIGPQTSQFVAVEVGLALTLESLFIWLLLVHWLSHPKLQTWLHNQQRLVNKLTGGLLLGFGGLLMH